MPLRGCALPNAPGCCGNQGSRGVSAGLGGAHPHFLAALGPGQAAAVRGGGGVPLPWQGCARRAHSSPGWERPGDTRRGVTGAAEKGGGRVRTREESRTRHTRASGVAMGSLECAPQLPALRRGTASPSSLSRWGSSPSTGFPGKGPGVPTAKVFGFLGGPAHRAKCQPPTFPSGAAPRLRPEALQLSPSAAPAPPACPLSGWACTANYSKRAAADYSGVWEAAEGGDIRPVTG